MQFAGEAQGMQRSHARVSDSVSTAWWKPDGVSRADGWRASALASWSSPRESPQVEMALAADRALATRFQRLAVPPCTAFRAKPSFSKYCTVLSTLFLPPLLSSHNSTCSIVQGKVEKQRWLSRSSHRQGAENDGQHHPTASLSGGAQ